MELLAPAGNIEKLETVYRYGADAAYIGVGNFSLRSRAENFDGGDGKRIEEMKGARKLYAALNIYFHDTDLAELERNLDVFAEYPFDAFIISDIGALPLLKRRFPRMEYHLSTQANCINSEAAKMYADMGFSRIIPGRELSLNEIAELKKKVPELEIETFIHGAMCLAYSGRCFLSSWMSGRSANQGDCSHSCRWNYRLVEEASMALEEKKRPGEYYPVMEGEGFTTVMSSKDICMIDYMQDLYDAGVDSVKIEGRMKSLYYAAMVTRAYRKEIDRVSGADSNLTSANDTRPFREELYKVSHREFSTGFYFGSEEISKPNEISYARSHMFLGTIGAELSPGRHILHVKNQIRRDDILEYIGPNILFISESDFVIYNRDGEAVEQADHGKYYEIQSSAEISEGYIVRKEVQPNP